MRLRLSGLSTLQVLAVDGGNPAKTGSALVHMRVEDVDDNLPQFTASSYQFDIAENSPIGAMVGSVTALDNDLAPYNDVYYWLLRNDHLHSFAINPNNG